jgi:hypothetical protein
LTTGGGRVGRAGGIGIGDHGAETVPDDDRPLAAQGGADGPDVGRLRALVIAVGGVRGEAHAAPVGHHHGMVPGERRRQGRPHVAGGAEAVEQHDRRPMTAGPEMNRRPVIRRDLLRLEVARKRLDLRGRGPRQGECPKEASPKNRRNN